MKNKEQALARLTELEKEAKELRKIIDLEKEDQKISKEQRFLDLVKDPVIKIDHEKYPNIIFFFTKEDNNYLGEYNSKNGYLRINYKTIWSVFEMEYGMEYSDTQSFIKDMVEEHFKLRVITPNVFFTRIKGAVEEHFKLKGVTHLL